MLYISEKNKIVVDVTKPPYSADPTGQQDCTEALCRALDDILAREIEGVAAMRRRLLEDPRDNFRIGFENRKMNGVPTVIFPEDPPPARILYFPAGTYLISDTITYSFENLVNLIDDKPSSDLNRFIRFKGAGMDKTVIRLRDHCRAFRYGEKRPMIAFARTRSSNVNMMNSIEDMTLDCGVGNTGAVGLRFSSSNTGKIRNLTIRTSDPDRRGYAGMLMDAGHQCYAKNLHIEGFEYGMLGGMGCVAFEHVTVRESRRCAVSISGGTIGFRDLLVESVSPALSVSGVGMVDLHDSTLRHSGNRGGVGVGNRGGLVYLRNVTFDNYQVAVSEGYENVYMGDLTVRDYSSCSRFWQLFPQKDTLVGLPVEESSEYEWNGDRSIVAEVDDFGAVGDGKTDSTAAIAAAMNSGKEYIVFGEGRYLCSDEIRIPKTVKAINFMYCDFAVTPAFAEEKEKGLFAIEEDSPDMLYIEDGFVFEKFYGYVRFIRHSAKRDLTVSDLHVQTGAVYFNTVPGSRVFMDNVASTMGVFGGVGYGTVPCFLFSGQKVWSRQLNPERSTDNVIAENGCDFWLLGFKTEGPSGKAFHIRNHSRAEIFCGNAIIATDDGTPCIENNESSVFAWCRTGGCGPHHRFEVVVKETQNGCERKLLPEKMPPYGVEYYNIPGYIGLNEAVEKAKHNA